MPKKMSYLEEMNKFIKTCKLPKLESLRYKEIKQTYTSKEIQIVTKMSLKVIPRARLLYKRILPKIYRKINASYSQACPKTLTQGNTFKLIKKSALP